MKGGAYGDSEGRSRFFVLSGKGPVRIGRTLAEGEILVEITINASIAFGVAFEMGAVDPLERTPVNASGVRRCLWGFWGPYPSLCPLGPGPDRENPCC